MILTIKYSWAKTTVAFGAILTMALWAICYPLISLSLRYAPIMWTASLRATIAGGFLISIAILLKRPAPRTKQSFAYLLAIGVTATSIGFWGMFYAGSLLSPGLATVLTNTQPLIAGLLGWQFLNERIGMQALIGTLLGFTGIVVISADSLATNTQLTSGIAYVVTSAIAIAVSNILLKKTASTIDVLYAMGLQLLVGAMPLALVSWIQDPLPSPSWNWAYAWIIILLSLPGTALPFILWFWLMDKAPLYKLNVYSFLTPVFGLYFGFTYFSESLSPVQWLGVLLTLGAIPLVNLSSGKPLSHAE